MLNRLFIAIGVLVILILVTAFVVPRLITWSDYRPRLEGMASAAFGTKVSIEGDIALTLLPQPELRLTKVRMGPVDAPVVEIDDVEAEFSLLDFLRDAYSVTKLTIDHPVVNIAVGADGTINSGLAVSEAGAQPNVTVPHANVVNGAIHLVDARSAKTYAAESISGELTLEAIKGPFSFEGQTDFSGSTYSVHVGLGRLDAAGGPALGLLVQSSADRSTLQTDGMLQAGPHYVGTLKYRLPPPAGKKGEQVDAGRGDFTIEGKLDAGTDRVALSGYTALPDENRPTTRLTGTAELKIGATPTFNATIAGGVVILPPRDATKELTDPPFELIRLLGELPLPPVPPIAGTIGLDVSELNLRAVSLRGVHVDAETDGSNWTVKSLSASLAGNSTIGLSGTLSASGGKPVFAGQVTVSSQQLDRLAALWRRPAAGDPLLDTAGSLTADVALSADKFALRSGKLTVGQLTQPFDAEIGLGQQRSLKIDAHWGTLGADNSAAIAALMPEITANGSFGTTFPSGEIHLSADRATVLGLDGSGLAADVDWDGGVLEFTKLAATDLGGLGFDTKVTAFGTLGKPEISGVGSLKVAPSSAGFKQVLEAIHVPQPVLVYLAHSLPAEVTVKLDAPAGNGGQALAVIGTLNGINTRLSATLSAGVANALKAPITATLDMTGTSPRQLMSQLGFVNATLFDESKPLQFTASIDGVPSNSYETHVHLASGNDHLGFAGNVVPGDFTTITGAGDLDVVLSDPTALAEALGVTGIYLPPVSGTAKLQFTNLDSFKASEIALAGVSGELSLTRSDGKSTVAGSLGVPALDAKSLLPFLVGPSGTLSSSSVWPDGPIDLGDAPRPSEGRIDIKAPSLAVGLTAPFTDVAFGFDWDAQKLHLRDLTGKLGNGTAGIDATLCCTGASMPTKQINARFSMNGVALDSFVPTPIDMSIKGTLQASGEIDGTGATLAEAVAGSTGTGSYSITDFSAPHFNPGMFDALSSLTDIVDMEPDVLSAAVQDRLATAPFVAPTLTGGFTIAGGVLRSPNLAIVGQGAKIFGTGSVSLSSLALDGRYAMTPATAPDESSPLDANSAEVSAVLGGSIWSPQVSYDVADLAEGMKIKASEVELAVLEQRKAEADARAKAQVEADARRDAEQKAEAQAIIAQQAVEAAANATAVAAEKAAKLAAAAAKPVTAPAPSSFELPAAPAPPNSSAGPDQGL